MSEGNSTAPTASSKPVKPDTSLTPAKPAKPTQAIWASGNYRAHLGDVEAVRARTSGVRVLLRRR